MSPCPSSGQLTKVPSRSLVPLTMTRVPPRSSYLTPTYGCAPPARGRGPVRARPPGAKRRDERHLRLAPAQRDLSAGGPDYVLRDGVSQGTVKRVRDIDHSTLVRMIVGDDTVEGHRNCPVLDRIQDREAIRLNRFNKSRLRSEWRNLVAERLPQRRRLRPRARRDPEGLPASLARAVRSLREHSSASARATSSSRTSPSDGPTLAKTGEGSRVVLVLPNWAAGAASTNSPCANISLPSQSRILRSGSL